MKRKKALKKLYPNRHAIIKSLRSTNHLKEVTNSRGKTTTLNIMKHLLYERPYKHHELISEMNRFGNHMMKKIMAEKEEMEKEVVVEKEEMEKEVVVEKEEMEKADVVNS